MPEPPAAHADLVYLCFPNNPTGAVATRAQLTRWVDYAREHNALLLYDAAYEGYISEPEIPHSIFEIPGARECAIEFRSFSKNGRLHRSALRIHRPAESGARADAGWPIVTAASALASALEHKGEWRQLPRAARRRSALQ